MNLFLIYGRTIVLVMVCMLMSCERFLDEKMLKSLTIPTTVEDLNALLNATGKINISVMPSLLEVGTDDYIIDESGYNNLNEFEKQCYQWSANLDYDKGSIQNEWGKTYEVVLIANTVLEYLPKVLGTADEKKKLKGEALFLRAWCFYNLSQIYCTVYNPTSDNLGLGIPLRKLTDLNVENKSSNVSEVHSQIVSDLKEAIVLLPEVSYNVARPNRTAGLALLARVYLSMSDYVNAEVFSKEALDKYDILLDYNSIAINANAPFERFNEEILYYSMTSYSQLFNPNVTFIQPTLYDLYKNGDLRKIAFFAPRGEMGYSFKGSYDGNLFGSHFVGLTTSEMYLTLAECLVRNNEVDSGIQVLNRLVKKRWDENSYTPLSIGDKEEALKVVLEERRKELLFRGVRWTDIRRLNLDSRFETDLTRVLGSQKFALPAKDLRFVYLIPDEVIRLSGVTQNPR